LDTVITTNSEQETETLGQTVGELLFPGAVLLLDGNLGAGKTAFARGVARGLGVTKPVQSPTFTILYAHSGRLAFYHFDLYRLEDEQELLDIGIDEYLDDEGVSLVEWAGKFPTFFTMPSMYITIVRGQGEDVREIKFSAGEERYRQLLTELLARS
jgi:tRNA threonylcarbamoyladenosine biosynthesis protein TsaE